MMLSVKPSVRTFTNQARRVPALCRVSLPSRGVLQRSSNLEVSCSSGFSNADGGKGKSLSASWSRSKAAVAVAEKPDVTKEYIQLWAGIGMLYTLDYFSKKAFLEAGIKFPASLIGMFAITILLMAIGEENAASVRSFFTPALNWIAKWLPVFYVPALVTLPLALQGLSNTDLGKIVAILMLGMVASLLFTVKITMVIRDMVKTPTKEVGKAKAATPFLSSHILAWGAIAAASFGAIVASPAGLGSSMALPFMMSFTIIGYLLGNAVPSKFQGILHPVLSTALAGNLGAAIYGVVAGCGYDMSQKIYLAKGVGALGAGDALMSFLGSVILSMGFRIYDQRETMKRHAPEIVGATLASSIFSFFSTAVMAKALCLGPELARALIPRCVTVALALPIGIQLEAPLSIVAAGVLVNCLFCANFGVGIINAFGVKDTIARGLAMAAAGGGFGTAAISGKEPEALPFCALSYSMVGIISTFLVTLPPVRAMLLGIVG